MFCQQKQPSVCLVYNLQQGDELVLCRVCFKLLFLYTNTTVLSLTSVRAGNPGKAFTGGCRVTLTKKLFTGFYQYQYSFRLLYKLYPMFICAETVWELFTFVCQFKVRCSCFDNCCMLSAIVLDKKNNSVFLKNILAIKQFL